MKKILSILFVAIFALGIASCNKNASADKATVTPEEQAVTEFETLCDKMVDAANANNVPEVMKLYGEMMELTEKYAQMDSDGELKLSKSQERHIEKAIRKASRAMNAITDYEESDVCDDWDGYDEDNEPAYDEYYDTDDFTYYANGEEEKYIAQLESICNRIVAAANNDDYAEMLSLSTDMMKLGTEIDEKEKAGELNFTEEQMERVQRAIQKIDDLNL